MTVNHPPIEFPPYQAIDVILGSNKDLDRHPVAGWVISEAGCDRQCFPNGKSSIMTDDPNKATEAYEYALSHSKYPQSVRIIRAWIHSQQRVYGEICSRDFWTLR